MRRAIEDFDEHETEANRVTKSLAAMTFALLLVVAGLFLVQHLERKALLEDCLLAGRMNCDIMVPSR
jgi:hypothetical protein